MWNIETTDVFDHWFNTQNQSLKNDILAAMLLLKEFGPQLGRPYVDTVNDLYYPNKETRMSTLEELMAKQSAENQKRILKKVEVLKQNVLLSQLREELNLSQTELANEMGVKQPTLAKIEQPDNDPRLSTLKRYVTALGGELIIDVTLPTGKRVSLHF